MASKDAIEAFMIKNENNPVVKSLKIFMRYMQFEAQDHRKLGLLGRFSLISGCVSDDRDAIVDF